MGMKGLGRLFDVCLGINLVADLAAGNNTGKRVHMKNYGGIAAVLFCNAVSAGTDTFVIDWQQHTANTAGTSADLDSGGVATASGVTEWYDKSATTLAGTEAWTRNTQTAASEISLTGATYSAKQQIVVSEITADQLADGYEWVSVDIADPGTGGTRLGGVLYIPFNLAVQRRPDALAQPNA